MSDDEEMVPKQIRNKVIHYGSLEENIASIRNSAGGDAPKISRHEILETDFMDSEVRQEQLEEYEKRKKARLIHVSTDDSEVKAQLRQLGEPICYFGEGPADRRDRLRELLALRGQNLLKKKKEELAPRKAKQESEKVTWYHEGKNSLQEARAWIANYSIIRAAERIKIAKEEKQLPTSVVNTKLQDLFKRNRMTSLIFSQIADTRPISYCSFSPNSGLLATASWNGLCKLWSIPECEELRVLRGHNTQVGCISFHPQSTLSISEDCCNLATCAHDGTVKLWSLIGDTPIDSIDGHEPNRVTKAVFHPSGKFLATCCFDSSWRLFDLEVKEEILHQEGHCGQVYDISFQCDGSLALTGATDSFGRLWDLRTGRCVMFLEGHLKSILTLDFSPNGYQAATGSEDHSVKIWDMRQRGCLYTIPAHTNIVSRVRFQRNTGLYLVSCSYDKTAKIWNHPNWSPSQALAGHEGRVMSCDVSNDDKYIATTTYDKSFKLWSPDYN